MRVDVDRNFGELLSERFNETKIIKQSAGVDSDGGETYIVAAAGLRIPAI